MALISDFFRICKSGATIDGRKITDKQIDQMAETYDRKIYGARIWIEHLRSISEWGSFPAMGDVVALDVENADGEKYLRAKISPLPQLSYMNKMGQKIFSSIEITPNFAKTGKAYLTGLAVTDSPASLGVEAIKLSALKFKNVAVGNIQNSDDKSDDFFTSDNFAINQLNFTNEEEKTKMDNENQSQSDETLLTKIRNLFADGDNKIKADIEKATAENTAEDLAENTAKTIDDRFNKIEKSILEIGKSIDLAISDKKTTDETNLNSQQITQKLGEDLTALVEKLKSTTDQNHIARPDATDINNQIKTDC